MKNKTINIFTRPLLLALLLLGTVCAQAKVELLDQVIAIVDDDVILQSELNERMQAVMINLEKSGNKDKAPPIESIQKELIDQLILENIQLQMAYRAGVRISDAQLNESMQRIAEQNRMDLPQFKAALESDGLSYINTREQVRREMLIQRVQQGNVNPRVHITDQEINNFLASEEGKTLTAAQYRVMHALIVVPTDASEQQIAAARSYANELYQRIEQGESYEAVVRSTGPFSINSSDLGWRSAEEMPSLLAGIVSTLATGQTAPPLQSPSGFHLVKMLDKRGDGETINQTLARHILLKPSAIRDEEATRKEIIALRKEAIADNNFAELARANSEDIGSAVEGGELGWSSPGQFVPAFQKAMEETAIGDISPAFRSQFGWHILKVEDRRVKDVTEDLRKRMASNYIHKRKYDDELQAWLQKIRDEAYVDFK
jgi:peptidyl-prolyl cis-trans isomerase SurA